MQNEIWITISETAKLLSLGNSAIEKALKRTNTTYVHRRIDGRGRGGKQIQVLLSSLPQQAQERYHNKTKVHEPILHFTQKQRSEADFKAQVVREYQLSRLSPEAFIKQFNTDNNTGVELTRNKLFSWQRKLKDSNNDVASLIDERGGNLRGTITIEENVWNYFYSLYMTEQKLSVKRCYELTCKHFCDKQIQSKKTFERKVKTIPEHAIIRYRFGLKAFNDSLSYMERDYSDLQSNDIWFSDHHLADVFVRDSKGKIGRPWITMWSDARSRKIMSTIVRMQSPNTDVVKESLRDAIYDNGIPSELYVDNGKDYKAKDGLSNDYPLSLVNRLGIKTIYATPYHGQAKSIERFFRTLEDRFGKMFKTYAGKDAKDRPESLKDVPLEEYPTLEEFTEKLHSYLNEFHETPHRGQGMNSKSPNQVYYEELHVKRSINDRDALTLLCGRTDERTVHKNGIRIFDNSFWNDELLHYFKQKVVVIYDPKNIDELNVFDLDGRSICKAYPKVKTLFRNTTKEDFTRAKKEQKAIKDMVKAYEPKRYMDTSQLISHNQAMDEYYKEQANTQEISVLTPELHGDIKNLKESEKRVNTVDDDLIELVGSMNNYYANAKTM